MTQGTAPGYRHGGTMSVTCNYCAATVPTRAKMPLRVVTDDTGKQVIPTDYSTVYEHMRDEHPEHWNDALAAEFEEHKAT